MKLLNKYTLIIFLATIFASCNESRKRATETLNELTEQAEELNKTVDEGIKKIEEFDSVIASETKQIREIDSLIDEASSKIDSVANDKVESWNNLTN